MIKSKELELAAKGEGCLGKAADDEPLFILRAQDVLSAPMVRKWAELLEAASHPNSTSRDKVAEARQLSKQIEEWQKTHNVKLPD